MRLLENGAKLLHVDNHKKKVGLNMGVSFFEKNKKNKGLPAISRSGPGHAEKVTEVNQQVSSSISLLRPLVDIFERLGHVEMSSKVSEALSQLIHLGHCRIAATISPSAQHSQEGRNFQLETDSKLHCSNFNTTPHFQQDFDDLDSGFVSVATMPISVR